MTACAHIFNQAILRCHLCLAPLLPSEGKDAKYGEPASIEEALDEDLAASHKRHAESIVRIREFYAARREELR